MEYVPTLKKHYRDTVIPNLKDEFNYSSVMQVPRLQKIVLNQGIGLAVADKKLIDIGIEELSTIAGQKAVQTVSSKDISNFKLRKKMPIGVTVTLLDGRGNFTLGITEQIIFPEIDIDKLNKILGLQITFVTSARTDEEGYALLREFGLPFKSQN